MKVAIDGREPSMIAIVIDSMERYYFIARLVRAVKGEFEFIFLTSEPLAHACLLLSGFQSRYLKRGFTDTARIGSCAETSAYQASIEVLNGQITLERAAADCTAILREVASILRHRKVSQCLMWNGQQLICRAVSHACALEGVPMKFLEISNLPNKLFVDPKGVNALSSISEDSTVIDRLAMPTENEHRRWLLNYEQYKAKPLPQSRTSIKRKAISLVNYGVKLATRGVGRKALHLSRVINSLSAPKESRFLSAAELSERSYVFLPLQVSSDTQIKLHSDVDNLQAISIAAEYAVDQGLSLLVKLHPAESDAAQIADILRLRETHGFELITSQTTDTIKHAQTVITINSTVGLEALLYQKHVISLGRCFYKNFDKTRLLKYIHSFLIDGIDYFGSTDIDAREARRVLVTEY
jgi:capsular polysaccharide export protein